MKRSRPVGSSLLQRWPGIELNGQMVVMRSSVREVGCGTSRGHTPAMRASATSKVCIAYVYYRYKKCICRNKKSTDQNSSKNCVKKQQHRRKNSAQLIPRGSSIGRSGKFNRELLRCSQQNRRQPAIPVARRASAREADGASAHGAVRVHGGGARYCDTVSGCGEAQPS
jgi:hypothetical protein